MLSGFYYLFPYILANCDNINITIQSTYNIWNLLAVVLPLGYIIPKFVTIVDTVLLKNGQQLGPFFVELFLLEEQTVDSNAQNEEHSRWHEHGKDYHPQSFITFTFQIARVGKSIPVFLCNGEFNVTRASAIFHWENRCGHCWIHISVWVDFRFVQYAVFVLHNV